MRCQDSKIGSMMYICDDDGAYGIVKTTLCGNMIFPASDFPSIFYYMSILFRYNYDKYPKSYYGQHLFLLLLLSFSRASSSCVLNFFSSVCLRSFFFLAVGASVIIDRKSIVALQRFYARLGIKSKFESAAQNIALRAGNRRSKRESADTL